MAVSRYTTPFQVSTPTSVLNIEGWDRDLAYKQAAYDQGYLAVDQSIKALNSLDLIRPQDIEYRNKKVGELTEQLNSYGNLDLSDPKITAKLTEEAQSLARDPQLMSMLQSTRNARQLIDRYAKLKENPKLIQYYSPINEYADMKEYSAWINGQTGSMSKSSPTLKVDSDKKVGEILKNIAPKVYSETEGLYIVNSEVRSQSDLKRVTLGEVESNPEIAAQLMRNADYVFRNDTPAETYKRAIDKMGDDISQTQKDIITYENRLKVAGISKEEKASLKKGIDQLKDEILPQAIARRDALNQKYQTNQFDPQEVANLKYQSYANDWVNSVTQPYVISRSKRVADNAAIFAQRRLDDATKESNRIEFQREQNALNRAADLQAEKFRAHVQLGKEGYTYDDEEYQRTGKFVPIPLSSVDGIGSGEYLNLPADSPAKDYDVVKQMDDRMSQILGENKTMLTRATLEIIGKTDPTLAGKLRKIYENNGDISQYKGAMSDGQRELLSTYDSLLDDASDPDKLMNNPALNQYGAVSNQINENLMKWNALNSQKEEAIKSVYNEAVAQKRYKGSYDQFIGKDRPKESIAVQALRNSNISAGTAPGMPKYLREVDKYTKQINEKLRGSALENEFMRYRSVAPEDKRFNDPSSPLFNTMLKLGGQSGIIIDGVNYSINGKRQNNVTYRDDIPGITQVRVDGLIPNTNQVEVTLFGMEEDDKKPKPIKSGIMQLNPDQMKDLIGRNSDDQIKSLHPYLIDGVMQDRNGRALYFNLNGDIPNMVGNIKYRFYDKGGRNLGISIPTMVNGKEVESHLPELTFEGENAHLKAKQFLVDLYKKSYQKVKFDNPDITSHEELSRLALKYFQDNID